MIDVPFSRCYWMVPGQLLAGYYPGRREYEEAELQLQALLASGIRSMINLTELHEQDWSGSPAPSYRRQVELIAASMNLSAIVDRIPIKDTWVPSRVKMCQIPDRIDHSLEQNKPVYVHFWGGRDRTGTVVGCYLVRHGLAFPHNVLVRIQELRKNTPDHNLQSPETSTQVEFILSWVEGE
jgi:protein tyrosine/serine phosphatase